MNFPCVCSCHKLCVSDLIKGNGVLGYIRAGGRGLWSRLTPRRGMLDKIWGVFRYVAFLVLVLLTFLGIFFFSLN